MVSFRFHLVSLVAVFLALALGIGMGATVIDKATVDSLRKRVATVEQQRDANNQQINDLSRRLNRSTAWESQAEPLLINNALKDVPVTLIGVRGIDEGILGDQKKLLQSAGAKMQGTLWFPAKANLTESSGILQLQAALNAPSSELTSLRQVYLSRIGAVMAGAQPPSVLKDVQKAGFLEWEGGLASDISGADFAGSRLIMMSSAQASVPNDQIATPFVKLIGAQPTRRIVAIEAGRDADARTNTSGARAVWLDAIRKDSSLDGRVSTVDDVETDLGRTSTVLAAQQLEAGKVGDYGIGDSASSPLPKLGS